MTVTASSLYATTMMSVFTASVNWPGDDIYLSLMSSSYSPNLSGDTVWSTISQYEVAGSGYTAGGQLLTDTAQGVLAYSSVGGRLANTQYAIYEIVSVGTLIYVCVAGGTTAITTPTFPVVQGQVVEDGTASWACLGAWLAYFTSNATSWNPLSVTAEYGVIHDGSSGQLISLINLGSSTALTGPWGLAPDPVSGWFYFGG